jgi:hypothetical protein
VEDGALRTSENSVKAKFNFAEFPFRNCPKWGTSNTLSVDLGGVERPKRTEKHRFGGR